MFHHIKQYATWRRWSGVFVLTVIGLMAAPGPGIAQTYSGNLVTVPMDEKSIEVRDLRTRRARGEQPSPRYSEGVFRQICFSPIWT